MLHDGDGRNHVPVRLDSSGQNGGNAACRNRSLLDCDVGRQRSARIAIRHALGPYMDICTPAVAATQFTAYMAMINLTVSYSSFWHGSAVGQWGYPTTMIPRRRPGPDLSSLVAVFVALTKRSRRDDG